MEGRRFIYRALIACGLLLALIGAINSLVNPYSEYSWQIIIPAKVPTRIIKKEVLEKAEPPIGAVIFGSSRVAELDPRNMIPGGDGINLAIYNPSMEDIYAMWKYLLELHPGAPDNLILGLDIGMFHPGPMMEAGLYAIPELRSRLSWTTSEKTRLEYIRFRRLFRLYALEHSFRILKSAALGRRSLINFDERGIPYIGRAPTGKAEPGDKLVKPPQKIITKRFKELRKRLVWFREIKYRDFDEIGTKKMKLLDEILSEARNKNTRSFVFLTPMHPEMVQLAESMTPLDRWRREVKALCEKYKIAFIDLSDSREVPYLPSWAFLDAEHLSSDAVNVLAGKLSEFFAKNPRHD